MNLQNILEGGECFEALIDYPSWIDRVRRYADSQDYGLFIDDAFVSIRRPGEAINMHSGAEAPGTRSQFRFHNNQLFCGQVNALVALTDIEPRDGTTMVIPTSHKSNLLHPSYSLANRGSSMDGMFSGVEVCLKAGDALLFVDFPCHGSAVRANEGERRVLINRYPP